MLFLSPLKSYFYLIGTEELAHLENRKAKFTVEDIIKLCLFYNVSADYVLGITHKEKTSIIKNQINSNNFEKITLK